METLWPEGVLRLLDWHAPVEILLIGLGLYLLYRNLSAMGAWKIALGILLGLAVFVAARILEFRGIEWILSRFSGVALIALIVLFQPEIRRLIERAVSFRRGERERGEPQLSSLLADLLFNLAGKAWGAIIVLPGREDIAKWTSTGVLLGAKPSFPLLASLFDPSSPGHDGAVVVDNGVATAFGVRLPLSRGGGLSKDLGTRHHAALGLSQVTDALVLVVSEERRVVSAFLYGKLVPVTSKEELVREIHEHWERTASGGPRTPAPWRRRLLSRPLLGSLVVATLFWLAIVPQQGEELEMSLQVPVEYTAAPSHLSLSGERADSARLLVSGEAAKLSRIDPSSLRLRVDLSAVKPGRQLMPLTSEGIDLPPGVNLIDVEPSSLALDVSLLIEKELPVRPQLIGAPAEGFTLETAEVRPRTLRVLLPEGESGAPVEILTAPIHLTGVAGPTRVISRVVIPPGVRLNADRWPDVVVILSVRPTTDR
jgi:DNA integrity scanning protein DisA with diadenylate cyclase activity